MLIGLVLAQTLSAAPVPEGRRKVVYWDKWTGVEGENLKKVIARFNKSQKNIWVDYTPVSAIEQKTLVAVAGGNAPDVAGLYNFNLVPYAEKGALEPLDPYLEGTNINAKHYLPTYWEQMVYQDKVYGLISTATTLGLFYNKKLFREAGLDPNQPPRTLAELNEYALRLTRKDKAGNITQLGFSPADWWIWKWGPYFGGDWWDGDGKITATAPENIAAFEWIQSYARSNGVAALEMFQSGFRAAGSASDPFIAGKVALHVQGVWYPVYLKEFGPDVEWAAAPFPPLTAGEDPPTVVMADMLMIPRGARNAKDAATFIVWMNQQGPMEMLAELNGKNSPLVNVSDGFYSRNANTQIRVFQQLAASKNAWSLPKMGVWDEYGSELWAAFDRVWTLRQSPKEALQQVQDRMQPSMDRMSQRRPPSAFLAWLPLVGTGVLAFGLAAFIYLRERRRANIARAHGAGRLQDRLFPGLLFASPALVGLIAFTAYPLVSSLIYAFCDYSVLAAPRWVGLENFQNLFKDEVFLNTLKVTFVYSIVAVPLGLIFSISCAILLSSNIKGTGIYRTLFFLPVITPLVANAIVWQSIFNSKGILNHFLQLISGGHFKPLPWIADQRLALFSLVLMSMWGVGQTIVIMMAALQDVSSSIYEAAELDGANWFQKIWHIALPSTSPVIFFNLVMGIIGALQVFAVPYIMTGGGPARSTQFYTMYLWDNAFIYLRMGYASAMGWLLFVIILLLTLGVHRASRDRIHYVGGAA